MSRPRFVLDTGVIVSAILFEHSVPRQAFELALKYGDVLLSTAVLLELNEVLRRKKFDRYITDDERLRFLAAFLPVAMQVEVAVTIDACRDPKDNKFLELAVCGPAVCIITGDQDLLALHPFHGIKIFTAAAFIAFVEPK